MLMPNQQETNSVKTEILTDFNKGMYIVRMVHKYRLNSDIIVEILKEARKGKWIIPIN